MSKTDCSDPREGDDKTYCLTVHQFTRECPHQCSREVWPRERDEYRIEAAGRYVYLICGDRRPRSSEPFWTQEILRYNLLSKSWCRLVRKRFPVPVQHFYTALRDNTLFLWNGHLHDEFRFRKLRAKANYGVEIGLEILEMNEIPFNPIYYSVVLRDDHLYAVGGTTLDGDVMDVLAFDIRSREWTKLNANDSCAPKPRHKHVVIAYNDRLYVFGDSSAFSTFNVLHAFNLETLQWEIFQTIGDFPRRRKESACVQDPRVPSVVYVNGGWGYGHNITHFKDTWRIDLGTLTWTRVKMLDLRFGMFRHSITISPQGRMFIYGGVEIGDPIQYTAIGSENDHASDENVDRDESSSDDDSSDYDSSDDWRFQNRIKYARCLDGMESTAELYWAWLKIPDLEVVCWEAIEYYNRIGVYTEMVKHYLPQKYADRLGNKIMRI